MIQQEIIISRIEDLLSHFGVVYKKYNGRLAFACPIHEGSKSDGASIGLKPKYGKIVWKCWTNHCEEETGKSLIGLIGGLLTKHHNKNYNFPQTIGWLEKYLNCKLEENESEEYNAKKQTINISLSLNRQQVVETTIPRNTVLEHLKIPADYFIKRGFSKEILYRYDVGICDNSSKQMYNRVVVPSYDDNHEFMVGCKGRTQKPQCVFCKKFHYNTEVCPTSSFDEYQASKWINSSGFNCEHYLYNFWFARRHINQTHTAILVEGAPDIWRLEESGINIGLALFGVNLSDRQIEKLEKLHLINLILATDNDEPGIEARNRIKERLSRTYNIFEVELPSKDVGELTIENTKLVFNPLLEKLHVLR